MPSTLLQIGAIVLFLGGLIFVHELGHFEHAWSLGVSPTFEATDGGYFLGRVVMVDGAAWAKMGPAQRLWFTVGGFEATQGAARALAGRILAGRQVDWQLLPLYLGFKSDLSLYTLRAPPFAVSLAHNSRSTSISLRMSSSTKR